MSSSYFALITDPLKGLISSAYNYTTSTSEEVQPPHPMSELFLLATLSFLPTNTKLTFEHCKVIYCRPGIQQKGRTITLQKCKELSNLKLPIMLALEWYNLKHAKINYIFKKVVQGLEKLQKTYIILKKYTIADAILFYKTLITNELDKTYVDDNVKTILNDLGKDDKGQRDSILDIYPESSIAEFEKWILKAEKTQGTENVDTNLLCHFELNKLDKMREEKDEEFKDLIYKFQGTWVKKE